MRISDWSSDVCSSDLAARADGPFDAGTKQWIGPGAAVGVVHPRIACIKAEAETGELLLVAQVAVIAVMVAGGDVVRVVDVLAAQVQRQAACRIEVPDGVQRGAEPLRFELVTILGPAGAPGIGRASCRERVGRAV